MVCLSNINGENKHNFCKDKGCILQQYNARQKNSNSIFLKANGNEKKKSKDLKTPPSNYGIEYKDKLSKYVMRKYSDVHGSDESKSDEKDHSQKVYNFEKKKAKNEHNKNNKASGQESYSSRNDLVSRSNKIANGKKPYINEDQERTLVFGIKSKGSSINIAAEKSQKANENENKKYKKKRKLKKDLKQDLFRNWKYFKQIAKKTVTSDKMNWMSGR